MAKTGKYIYGIINSHTDFRLSLPNGFLKGENESNNVYTVSCQDISAVVRDAEMVEYTCLPRDVLGRLLVGHQNVIERIMSLQHSPIPMRLGTFAQDEIEVKDILNKGYSLIKEILEKTKDKIEIDVACSWNDFASIIKEIGEQEEIKELKKRLLVNPQGVSTDDRLRIGRMLKEQLDRKREEYAFLIQETLKIISLDFKIHELMDDNMVSNCAFLIEKVKKEEFENFVEKLDAEFKGQLNFRCVGPLPAYSFYTLEIKKIPFQEVDWAKKRLGLLNDFVTRHEIKKAHQSMALTFHPDRNPNTPGIEKEFNEITQAYKILWEYCLSAEQAGQSDGCSFNEEEFRKNALLVKLRD